MNDRGVSELLGYVLVFGLITATIGVVFAGGMTGLESTQNAEQMNNVERAFDVFHDNVNDIHHDGAPSRATEIRMTDASVHYGETEMVITLEDTDDPDNEMSIFTAPDPVIYSFEETDVAYENGAVIRTDRDAGVMLNDPDIFRQDDDGPALISSVETYGRSPDLLHGDQTILIVTERSDRSVNRFSPSPSGSTAANVTLRTPRWEVWERYFEEQELVENIETDADENRVSAEFEIDDDVYAFVTEIDVEYQQ